MSLQKTMAPALAMLCGGRTTAPPAEADAAPAASTEMIPAVAASARRRCRRLRITNSFLVRDRTHKVSRVQTGGGIVLADDPSATLPPPCGGRWCPPPVGPASRQPERLQRSEETA